MATATWIAPSDSNWSIDSNWSTGYVPTIDDVVLFNSTSVKNCTVDVSAIDVKSFSATSVYTGDIFASGANINCVLGFSDDGSGDRDYFDSISCNGSGSTMHFGASLGTVNAASTWLSFGNTLMVLDCDRAITFFRLSLSEAATVTSSGSAVATFDANVSPINIGDYAALTISGSGIAAVMSGGGSLIAQGYSARIFGTSTLTFKMRDGSYTLSNYYRSGAGTTQFYTNGSGVSCSLDLDGDLRSAGAIVIFCNNSTSNLVFSTQSYNITATTFRYGCSNASGSFTAYYGLSNVTISLYEGDVYNSGSITQYFESSTWVCKDDWRYGSNHSIDAGNFTVNFTGASSKVAVTTQSQPFYDININLSYSITFTGDLYCNNITVTGGSGSFKTLYSVIASGNLYFGNSSIRKIMMSNSTGILTFNGSVSGYPEVVMTGANMTLYTPYATTAATSPQLRSLALGNYTVLSVDIGGYADGYIRIIGTTTLLTLGDYSTLACNNAPSRFVLSPETTMTVISFGEGATWNGDAGILINCPNSSVNIYTLPAIVYSGTGSWSIAPDFRSTVILSGILNLINSNALTLGARNAGAVFDSNGQQIICGDLIIRAAVTGGKYYFRDSTLNILSYSGLLYGGTQYFESSQWYCAGNWAFGTNYHVVDEGTSTVTITDTATITPNEKRFYDLIIDAPTRVVSAGGNITCHMLHVVDANYSQFTKSVTASGDILFDGSGTLDTGDAIISTGSGHLIRLSSSVSSVNSFLTSVSVTGLMDIQIDKDVIFKTMLLGNSSNAHLYGTGSVTLSYSGTPLTIGSSVGFTIDQPLTVEMNATGTAINCQAGSILEGTSYLTVHSLSNGVVLSVSALIINRLDLKIQNNTAAVSNTIQLTGELNTTGDLFLNNTNTGTLTFNSLSAPLSAKTISYGCSNASGTFISDFGSSNINTESLNPTQYNLGTNTIRYNKSSWSVSGNCVFPSSHSNLHAWDRFTFNGDSTVTCNGNSFNWLYLDSPAGFLFLTDNIVCREYKYISGTMDMNGNSLVAQGDCVEIVTTE